MKKLKCSVLAALCFASLSTSGWGQTQADFITGTHEEFENYLLLNKSVDNTITHWEAEFYQQYYDTVSQTVKENLIRTVKTETLDGYLYVDPSLKNETDYLKIVVNGLNDAGQKIVYDDIIPPVPNNHISLIPLCENSCIGKTYAYTIRINERYQYGNLLPGHQVDVVAKTGYPYEYEYFSNTAFNNMMSNSQGMNNTSTCDPSQSNTLCHYGLNYNTVASWLASPNGASGNNTTFIRHTGVASGTFQDKNNTPLSGDVWAVAKNFGKWRSETNTISNQLANAAATPCGQFGTSLTSMINYANNNIPLSQSLSCNGWAAGGGGVDPKPWADINFGGFVWSRVENNDDENAFDLIEEVGDIISEDFAGNNTGVPWWPSDSIRQIRIVNLGSNGANSACQGVIELYRDSLFVSETGELNYQSIALQPGLYSFLFINEDYQIDLSPLIMEKTNRSVSTTPLSSYLTVESIFPNPIESGELTTRVSADASLTFDYKITSVNGVVFYAQNDISIAKDKGMKLIISSDDLPSGSLIHTFIFEDGSTTSMTTIKQ